MDGEEPVARTRQGRIGAGEWRFFLFLWLGSFALGLVDLFGMGRASSAISQEVFYNVASTSILDEPPPPITVVLANDADLAALRVTWPLEHAVQAEIVSEILVRRPRALFIDFLFLDVRDATGSQALVDAVRDLRGDVPVFIVSPALNASLPLTPQAQALFEQLIAAGARPTNAARAAIENDIVIMPVGGAVPPTAVALRDEYCTATAGCASLRDRSHAAEIVWRAVPPACDQPAAPDACRSVYRSWPTRLAALVWRNTFPPRDPQTLAAQGLLPYPTISASGLLDGAAGAERITGSVVFYGGSFRGSSDVVPSVVYGDLPGVFVHAAYFDNLVTLGDWRFRPDLPAGASETGYAFWLTGLLAAILCLVHYAERRAKALAFHDQRALKRAVWVMTAASLLIALVEAVVLRTTPEHWLIAPQLVLVSLVGTYAGLVSYADALSGRVRGTFLFRRLARWRAGFGR